jgi:uncharacterized protein (UPF0548 family)
MRAGWLAVGRPSAMALSALLDSLAAEPVTYPGVGATLRGGSPPGWSTISGSTVVGHGDDAFADAGAAIRAWAMQVGGGFRLVPEGAPVEVGTQVAVVAPAGPFAAVACCRVVAVVDEPGRFGFAYGTLPVHPARGEEAFVVTHEPDGSVVFTVSAFSRPRVPAARLAGPAARWMQRRALQRYLDAVASFVAGHS